MRTPLIASNEFPKQFKNHCDPKFLGHQLADWHGNVGGWASMFAVRRSAFAERLPKVEAQLRKHNYLNASEINE